MKAVQKFSKDYLVNTLSTSQIATPFYDANPHLKERSERPKASLSELGCLTPIVVAPSSEGSYTLIDGYQRLTWARSNEKSLPAVVLNTDTPIETTLNLFVHTHRARLVESNVSSARCVCFLETILSTNVLLEGFFPLLGLAPSQHLYRQIRHIAKLPQTVLDFGHQKSFSFKQLYRVSRYPSDFLTRLFSDSINLHLTGSIAIEVLDSLQDLSKRNKESMNTLWDTPDLQQQLGQHQNPQQRTQALRTWLQKKRQPTLDAINHRIEALVLNATTSGDLTLSWDRSLENKEVKLTLSARSEAHWAEQMKTLGDPAWNYTIKTILDEL